MAQKGVKAMPAGDCVTKTFFNIFLALVSSRADGRMGLRYVFCDNGLLNRALMTGSCCHIHKSMNSA